MQSDQSTMRHFEYAFHCPKCGKKGSGVTRASEGLARDHHDLARTLFAEVALRDAQSLTCPDCGASMGGETPESLRLEVGK